MLTGHRSYERFSQGMAYLPWENLFMLYSNKDADQSAHLRKLISTFVVKNLGSIVPAAKRLERVDVKTVYAHTGCVGYKKLM